MLSKLIIITPSLNSKKYIVGLVENIKPLVNLGAQHVFVDSGSTDGTLDVLNSLGITPIYYPPGSIYSAINYGISKYYREWCTYINADDLVDSDAIIYNLNNYKGSDFIYGNFNILNDAGITVRHCISSPGSDLKAIMMSGYMPFSQPGTLFKRNVWEILGGFSDNYKLASDYDFFFRAVNSNFKFTHSNFQRATASFRVHEGQLSQIRAKELAFEAREIRRLNVVHIDRVEMLRSIFSLFSWRLRNFRSRFF
jgi:glycosyltransferase involved in cell wall biosynthesis